MTKRDEWRISVCGRPLERWAEAERPAVAARKLFEEIHALWTAIQREGDRTELVLGEGILDVPADRIRHPVLLQRLNLRFDPAGPEFRFDVGTEQVELHRALLRLVPSIDGRTIAQFDKELEAAPVEPLGGQSTTGFLRRLVQGVFATDGEYLDSGSRDSSSRQPSIRRKPVMFLRDRNAGLATTLDHIVEDLEKDNTSPPEGLVRIVGVEAAEPTGQSSATSDHQRPRTQPSPDPDIKLDQLGIEPLGEGVVPPDPGSVVERVRRQAETLRAQWQREREGSSVGYEEAMGDGKDGDTLRLKPSKPARSELPGTSIVPPSVAEKGQTSVADQKSRASSPPAAQDRLPGLGPSEATQSALKAALKPVAQPAPNDRVLEELRRLDPRLRDPRCSQCGHAAHLAITNEGIVVVCKGCKKSRRVDADNLQSLAERLSVTCFSCKRGGLESVARPFGNVLKCPNPGCPNNSWLAVHAMPSRLDMRETGHKSRSFLGGVSERIGK